MRTSPALRPAATVLAVAASLALGLVALGAGSAVAADTDVTWTVRTASNALGADRTGFEYTVDPGGTVDDAMVVANHGTTPLDLAVYAADGYTTDSGGFDLLVAGEKSHGVGAFVATKADHVTVPAGETVDVPFTVTVPDDATPGDYAGGLVTSLQAPDDEAGIDVDRRLGIRVDLHVGGELAPALAIEDVHVAYSGTLNPFGSGDATVTYTLHNTGNTALSAAQAASTSGPFGWLTTSAAAVAAPPELLPGESWEVTATVPDVTPAFRLTATATVSPLLTDASGSTTSLAPVVVTAGTWAVPWTLIALVVLLAAAVVVGLRVLRRRRAQSKEREDARVQEAVADALREREVTTH
ncbi:hypothetical protein Cch01nite_15220 [Cellulomonas chitinilytica]|uniref:DUF916 domain-containing protein n=1 Tax=Cellulomonas chitinilytica TaxID=398759 RepID=A0A919TZF1_9CELL|nr:DUF916 domain-containing protein [Cellulomonas chitinilytica]GIG20798.1 hypothetical protein Cch01nite_15220 [Cellulomonas chitinilytica]